MTPADDGHVREQIGTMSGKLDMLIEAVRRSEEKSDVNRASMHRRMDELVDRVNKVESTVGSVQADVSVMKPTVDEVKALKQRGIGALAIVGIGASIMTFLLTTYFSNITTWLTRTGP